VVVKVTRSGVHLIALGEENKSACSKADALEESKKVAKVETDRTILGGIEGLCS
jgi:hypothetical protein